MMNLPCSFCTSSIYSVRATAQNMITDELITLYRRHVFIGVNVVTKKLEKGKLDLVLTCSSAKPCFVTHHIITLCATRGVPAGCITGLSDTVSRELNLKSVLAIGFTSAPDITDLVNTVVPKLPKLNVPWLIEATNDKDIQESDTDDANDKLSLEAQTESNKTVKLVPARICVNKSVANKKQKREK